MKGLNFFRAALENKRSRSYLAVIFLCGVLLMLVPANNHEKSVVQENNGITLSLEKEEQRLENILSSIDGVGKCNVLLSAVEEQELNVSNDEQKDYAVVGMKSESEVTVLSSKPCYKGAVVVCGGCDNANIRFDVISAVMSYTGLSIDRITICPIAK